MSEHPTPTSHRRRRRWVVVVVAVVVAAVAGYAAVRVVGSQGNDSASDPTASPTPLASMDLSGLPVTRTSPCARIAGDDVTTALGGKVDRAERYAPGDRVRLSQGLRDVSQEFGCTYRDAHGSEARVWVFAQPVNRSMASRIVRDARAKQGCRPVQGSPGFGSPTVTTDCLVRQPRGRTVTLRGLFGETWLSCQLTAPDSAAGGDVVRRTQRWCVGVATGLGASG